MKAHLFAAFICGLFFFSLLMGEGSAITLSVYEENNLNSLNANFSFFNGSSGFPIVTIPNIYSGLTFMNASVNDSFSETELLTELWGLYNESNGSFATNFISFNGSRILMTSQVSHTVPPTGNSNGSIELSSKVQAVNNLSFSILAHSFILNTQTCTTAAAGDVHMRLKMSGQTLWETTITVLAGAGGSTSLANNFTGNWVLNRTVINNWTLYKDGANLREFSFSNGTNFFAFNISSNLTCTGIGGDTALALAQFPIDDWKVDNYPLPQGLTTVTVAQDGYGQRDYEVTLPADHSSINQTAYLLLTSEGLTVSYSILSRQQVVPNALVTAQRFIGTEYVTVQQDRSDTSGIAYNFLDPDVTYQVIFTSSDGGTLVSLIQPGASQNYQINLVTPTTIHLNTALQNVYYQFSPSFGTIGSGGQSVNFTAFAYTQNLQSLVMNTTLHYKNGTIISLTNESVASSFGGTLVSAFNLSAVNATNFDTVVAYAVLTLSSGESFAITRNYNVYTSTPGSNSFFTVFSGLKTSTGLSDFSASLIVLFIAMVFGGFINMKLPLGGYGTGILIMTFIGVFTFIGWFDQTLFVVILLITTGAYILVKGVF